MFAALGRSDSLFAREWSPATCPSSRRRSGPRPIRDTPTHRHSSESWNPSWSVDSQKRIAW